MKTRFFLLVIALTGLFVSCNEYYDDLESLGKRVEKLEDSTLVVTYSTLNKLTVLVDFMLGQGYVSSIDENSDGSCTIHLKRYEDTPAGKVLRDSVITLESGELGANGRDGKGVDALLGVKKGDDGKLYWTFNGSPLTDDNGNLVPVQGDKGLDGLDGKDGKNGVDGRDGKDGKDAVLTKDNVVLPQLRINPVTRTWQISINGGLSWTDTGVKADGEDGKDGKDGQNGQDGKNGKDGQKGADGNDGKDGKEDTVVVNIYQTDTEVVFVVHISPSGVVQTLVVPKE